MQSLSPQERSTHVVSLDLRPSPSLAPAEPKTSPSPSPGCPISSPKVNSNLRALSPSPHPATDNQLVISPGELQLAPSSGQAPSTSPTKPQPDSKPYHGQTSLTTHALGHMDTRGYQMLSSNSPLVFTGIRQLFTARLHLGTLIRSLVTILNTSYL